MSDHVWSQDQIEAFVVGGLTADEAERLEGHVRDCPDCAAAVAAARRIDRGLGGLFTEIRTDAGLEDRAVLAVRTVRQRRLMLSSRMARFVVAAGVLLALGAVGALTGTLISGGQLPLPGILMAKRSLLKPEEAPTAIE